MKRKREVEKKSDITSAIEELSLLVKVIRSSKHNIANHHHNNNSNSNNNNTRIDNNNNNIDDSNSNNDITLKTHYPTTVVAAAAGVGGAPKISTSDADQSLQQQQLKQQQFVRVVDLNIPTRPFLAFCSLIIQVLDKIGPTMAVLRQDIYRNIQRLEMLCDSDSTTYSNLVEILNKEAVERCAKKGDSCSKAMLWLTRCLDFTAALLQKLVAEPRDSMEQIVATSYETTLKPWHGWISATAYKVALKLVPETDTFICLLMERGETIDTFKHEVQCLISLLLPLLEDLHSTLGSYGLERLKST